MERPLLYLGKHIFTLKQTLPLRPHSMFPCVSNRFYFKACGIPWGYKNAPQQSATVHPEQETVVILSGTRL